MAMSTKQHKATEVDKETDASNNEHHVGVEDVYVTQQSLNCLTENREAQCNEEHGIYQRTYNFRPCPAVRVAR